MGRVSDWYKNNPTSRKIHIIKVPKTPEWHWVKNIYHYYKHFGYKTEIMGASFRSLEQVLALVGCDLLTIAPKFIEELNQYQGEVVCHLNKADAKRIDFKPVAIHHEAFLWDLCENSMVNEKLAEGIRLFHQDFLTLANLLEKV